VKRYTGDEVGIYGISFERSHEGKTFCAVMSEQDTSQPTAIRQGPKLTFLGRRQLATEFFFFSVATWKNVVAKKYQ